MIDHVQTRLRLLSGPDSKSGAYPGGADRSWSRLLVLVPGRLLLPGDTASLDLGKDVGLDQAFHLGAADLNVLWQQFVVESFADIIGPEGLVAS
ncbi:hypothetical protein [Streptomyces sp. NPDC058985]|uniref:hypothetical protein n=1 Tax=Streptomyces sp. NPDC058985 TaxID=3346684 RepID=UPI0036B6D9CB